MNSIDHSHPPGVAGVDDTAERWFVRLQRGDCSAAERRAFNAWQASPANAAAYARVAGIYRASADFARNPAYRAAGREARQRAELAGRRRRRVRRWTGGLAIAATLVLSIGLGWRLWDPAQPPQRFATVVGQQRTVELGDGSHIQLDTNSAVIVRYSRKQRDVVLERGRAQFDVAHVPQRPFTVHAGAGAVRALGTAFQVRHQAEAVQVVLLEGAVRVEAPAGDGSGSPRSVTMSPGQRLAFDAGGLWATDEIDTGTALGWTRGELVFRQRPLHELLEEANRYHPAQIRIGDAALYDLRVSGVFDSADQASLLQALESILPLRAERVSEREIVLHRQ